MNGKLLQIYLNDHRAGATAGRELAKRCFSNNRGTPLGDYLQSFIAELDSDFAAVEEVAAAVGTRRDRIKQGAAWFAEKVGRLKLNGQLTGYSNLSRLLELEGLKLGVAGKESLWISLKQLGATEPRLAAIDLDSLLERARRQLEQLETYRVEAARRAFAG